jgi:hypothetical protein
VAFKFKTAIEMGKEGRKDEDLFGEFHFSLTASRKGFRR